MVANPAELTPLPPPPRDDPAGLWRQLDAARTLAEAAPVWLLLTGARLPGASAALVLGRSAADGAFHPLARWPQETPAAPELTASAERCLAARRPHCEWQPPQGGRLAVPIEVNGACVAVVAVAVQVLSPPLLPPLLTHVRLAAGWLAARCAEGELQGQAAAAAARRQVLDVLARLAPQRTATAAALVLANELAQRFGARQAAVGLVLRGRLRLLALSHNAWFDRRSQLAQAFENALEETLDQGKSVVLPPLPEQAPRLSLAHRALADGAAVASVVLAGRGPLGNGALLVERDGSAPFTAEELARLEALAGAVGPLLEDKREAERWLAGRPASLLAALGQRLTDPRRPGFAVLALAGLVLLVAPFALDGTYRIGAKAVIEGEVQRALVAPFAGYLAAAPVRAGHTVAEGAVLASLDERELRLDESRLASEREQHRRKYDEALAKAERAGVRILAAQIAETDAQLSLVRDKLARARIAAPFAGVVVSGDLTQRLGGPVEQGETLFEVAPLASYRVILKVDERDIRDVAVGQGGELMPAGLAGEALPFVVRNIAAANAEEGYNLFRVEAELAHAEPRLRPGMEGVGKIVVGERRYAWIWTHRFFDWVRLKLWSWLP